MAQIPFEQFLMSLFAPPPPGGELPAPDEPVTNDGRPPRVERVPPPPGSPPSPWYGENYDRIFQNARDSGWGPNSPLGRYKDALPPEPNGRVIPGNRYYEDQMVVLQNRETGMFAMVPMATWLINRDQLAPTYTAVTDVFQPEDTMLKDQRTMEEFGLRNPTYRHNPTGMGVPSTPNILQMVPTSGSPAYGVPPQQVVINEPPSPIPDGGGPVAMNPDILSALLPEFRRGNR
jgi:hypothetical protein